MPAFESPALVETQFPNPGSVADSSISFQAGSIHSRASHPQMGRFLLSERQKCSASLPPCYHSGLEMFVRSPFLVPSDHPAHIDEVRQLSHYPLTVVHTGE